MPASRAEVSAHAADRTATIETFNAAVATGADYVELDIRRTADGALVAFHDPRTAQGEPLAAVGYPRLCELAGYQVPLAADVLATIKGGGAKGHLDLKDAGREDEVARLALDVLGPGQFIITTLEDRSVAALSARFPADEVPVALSLGRDMAGESRARWLSTRLTELRPLPRLRGCGAGWAAVERRLARAGVARQCHRSDVKIMVWTVNDDDELRYWLADGRADVIITDRPAAAIAFRDRSPA